MCSASDPGFYVILYELFTAGRQTPDIQPSSPACIAGSRKRVADVLRQKDAEGVISLRFDAEAVVTYMFAAADGGRCSASPTPSATSAHRRGRRRGGAVPAHLRS